MPPGRPRARRARAGENVPPARPARRRRAFVRVSMPFLNISTYRFVELDDLPALRDRLEGSADAAGLKGTLLLAHEGINLFMAGEEAALRGWIADALHAEPPFAGLPTQDSFSDTM